MQSSCQAAPANSRSAHNILTVMQEANQAQSPLESVAPTQNRELGSLDLPALLAFAHRLLPARESVICDLLDALATSAQSG
jgi:hypothetical protein